MIEHQKFTKFLEELNPSQREAVFYTDGPLLVLAGAGSGKTRVITYKIAYILSEGLASPYEILAVTFTNKAASEMKERVNKLLNGNIEGLILSTFHSFGLRLLRAEGFEGIVLDEDDRENLLEEVINDISPKIDGITSQYCVSKISFLKSRMISPEEFIPYTPKDKVLSDIYFEYERKKRNLKAVDFDDLLIEPLKLLKDEFLRNKYTKRFKYVLVDEYQDINKPQFLLAKIISSGTRRLTAVGDPDQSIYSWRGSDPNIILNFEEDFPEAKIIYLEQNYRSTLSILEAANSVISNNVSRYPKKLWTNRGKGKPVLVYIGQTELDESEFILNEINSLRKAGYSFKDIALLYRINAQSRFYEELFMRYGFPYKVISGVRFYERKEIKDALAYLRILVSPYDLLSLERALLALSRGIGKKTILSLKEHILSNKISIWEGLKTFSGQKKIVNALLSFSNLIDSLREKVNLITLRELYVEVLEKSGYLEMLRSQEKDGEDRLKNLEEMLTVISRFEEEEPGLTLEAFLDKISLYTDQDLAKGAEDAISLLTLHAAKGLEFPVVFMVGMEQGLFPLYRSFNTREDIEEERRLCYVGMTRAMDRLYMTACRRRKIFGSIFSSAPSMFISEIDPVYRILVEE
ncbi:MAG: UvrD-helicase domain-containing protein [Synergistetes bacterium]|nr:UvrD-helicase domain-containing protein [Synergistota bacterium]MCX8127319.1 UvrD-helicase domain-containing protein [Synergistota bacterium]MDW8191794.1 3'-5' exonuclease [Synergistota bacterium]